MEDKKKAFLQATSRLDAKTKRSLEKISDEMAEKVQEIRLISDYSLQIRIDNKIYELGGEPISERNLNECLLALCNNSLHSYQRQLAQGYLTIEGGHRAGFAATAVYDQNGNLSGFRAVTAIVIRIARDFNGISKSLVKRLFCDGICGVILAGAPSSGKTTMLRDMAREFSFGAVSGVERIAVADERGELGSCGKSVVLCGYDKAQAMLMAVKNLSAQVIFCDEIATVSEVLAVEQALNCGVSVITTVHAANVEQLLRRSVSKELLQSGAFQKIVFLSEYPTPCSVREVISCDDIAFKNAWNNTDSIGSNWLRDKESCALP